MGVLSCCNTESHPPAQQILRVRWGAGTSENQKQDVSPLSHKDEMVSEFCSWSEKEDGSCQEAGRSNHLGAKGSTAGIGEALWKGATGVEEKRRIANTKA